MRQYKPAAAVPLHTETHSGEDVPVWSSGPHSHLVTGVHEQSFIGHVIMYAACMGESFC